MLSEYEPTWNRDDLAMIFSPEAVLFANPLAQAACSADCLAASSPLGPLDPLIWCAGCQNSIYPMTGNVAGHESALQSSLLTVQRMHTKMHRSAISLDMATRGAMCSRASAADHEKERLQDTDAIAARLHLERPVLRGVDRTVGGGPAISGEGRELQLPDLSAANMLRVLIFSALSVAITVAVADESDFADADARMDDVQCDTRSAMSDVDAVDVSKTLPSF